MVLNDLYSAYAFESEDQPMYDFTDFRQWLKKFEDACELNPLPNENVQIKTSDKIKLINQNTLKLKFPSRAIVKEKLKLLLSQNPYYLAAISQWTIPFIIELDDNSIEIEDQALSKALRRLYWADMPSISEPRKFNLNDYKQWLKEFEEECAQNPIKD
jgi:hypothetical protein